MGWGRLGGSCDRMGSGKQPRKDYVTALVFGEEQVRGWVGWAWRVCHILEGCLDRQVEATVLMLSSPLVQMAVAAEDAARYRVVNLSIQELRKLRRVDVGSERCLRRS